MNITILGAGAFGSALGATLHDNGHRITFYDPIKNPKISLEPSIKSAEAIIMAAPSSAVPCLVEMLPEGRPFICASKGFLNTDLFSKFSHFSVLSGGAFASSLQNREPTTLTATSTFVQDLFKNEWLTIELTSDVRGVLICGALKNIYAIGAGLRALKPYSAEFITYIHKILPELREVLRLNLCDPATADLSCGHQDLLVTCSSTESRNYLFGTELKRNISHITENTTEGLSAVESINKDPTFKIPGTADTLREIVHLVNQREFHASK